MKFKQILSIAGLACAALSASGQLLPYQNPSLSAKERAADLCSRLTLEEKSRLMMNSSPAIERLGIPSFDWWSEALHGVGRNGLATVFPSCIGMAASFDDDLIEEVFTAVSDEARAKNTLARREGKNGKYKGLSFWTPNINVFRDPRWGRGQETYGEDPYMNGRMGLRVVKGLQGDGTDKYYKLHACAKHYAVHSGPERTRHRMDIESLPARELWETYLPAFKTLVQEGNVQQVMCAYQRFEGSPCCGSDRLLNTILRYGWGFDGLVVSDCGAIGDFYREGRHEVSKDAKAASALGVLSGTDVECGGVYKNLPGAVARGDISEADIDVSVKRMLKGRFELGDFDPDSLVSWTSIPMSVVCSPEHRALARKMAREQMVLLKNNGVLPLSADNKKIMLMGPNAADSTMMWGIYYGQPAHTVTILEGINSCLGREIPYAKGCTVTRMTDEESVFGNFRNKSDRGMKAVYWNNASMSGAPAVETVYTSPIRLDNGGNTAFAPGVNLTNFTTRIRGSYVADRDETLKMVYNNDDGLRIIVNGDTIHDRWRQSSLEFRTREFPVKKGSEYDIIVEYMQLEDGATLNFDLLRSRNVTPADAVRAARDVDIVIFAGGISPDYEREEAKVTEPGFDNGDRTSIELPAPQREILKALHKAGKKIVLVNCSGSAVALTPEDKICDAILQAWYPGEQGGHAVADVLFGDYNPSGKLPVTFYKDDSQLPAFDDYLMAGRTYRYMKNDEPLYKFGHGLSYTTFSIADPAYSDGKVTATVTNTGKVAGTEVVQVYMRRPADTAGPVKTLRGYTRVSLAPGESRRVEIDFPLSSFENWDESAMQMRVVPGEYELMVGSSSDDKDLSKIKVTI